MEASGGKDEKQVSPRYFTLDVEIEFGETVAVGRVAGGYRSFAPVSGGSFEGPGLSGVVRPIGVDSRLRRRAGSCTASVVTVLSTDDGACIALQCDGEGTLSGGNGTSRTDGARPSASSTLAVQCRLECGDARYGWLDGALAIGEARVDADHGDYRLFVLAS